MTSVFLSYARGDDGEPFDPATSFVARLHRDLTARGFDVWCDRVSMPSRSLTFHQEIRDAIAASERLELIVGPRAAVSSYVRQEWQFAWREADKVVTPILRWGDYADVPDELRLLHCEDFRDDAAYAFHLDNLVRQLSEPPPPLGKLIAVPSLPAHYLVRAERLEALRDALRADLDLPVVIGGAAARVGLHGMGGIGKSVLAAAVARDRRIREAFPDGIVWVGLGQAPGLADLMRRVHRDFGGDGLFATEHEGRVRLRELLANKAVLLILDDAWRRPDVDAFNVLGPRCRALVTTRDAGLLTVLGGTHHIVELLTDAEALRLLATAAGVAEAELPPEAAAVVAECGRLPLAVALCGALVHRGMAWEGVLEQFLQARIDRIADRHAVEPQHQSIWHAIHLSVEALAPADRERFLELAVFPPDETAPEPAIATLWAHTGSLDDWAAGELLTTLAERSLLQVAAAAPGGHRRFWLHDVVYDYVQRAAADPSALHTKFLAGYTAKCTEGWPTGPNDGYFYTHLRHHLLAAGRGSELANLLHQLPWLEAKNAAGLVLDLTADFRSAIESLPDRDPRRRILRLLDEALRRDIHFIARHASDYPQALFQCFWNNAWWYDSPAAAAQYVVPGGGWRETPPWDLDGPKLCELLESWRAAREARAAGFVWLRALRPPWVHLGIGQLQVLRGHEDWVSSVSFSLDGRRVASGSGDGTVRVWDVATGEALRVLSAHESSVTSVSFSPDGRRLASGCGGPLGRHYAVRVWDAETGEELRVLRGHESHVTSVSFSPDGRRLASGSGDRTIRVLDVEMGKELRVLRGHKDAVTSVSFSPDGRRLASGSRDETVRLWDAETGEELGVLHGHKGGVSSVSFSADGRRLASGSLDDTIRLWHAETGEELGVLHEHKGDVSSVSFSADGRRLLSGSRDRTVRVWDAETGEELWVLRGHESGVTSVSFSPDGRRLVSGSDDRTVRVWDATTGEELRVLRGHRTWMKSLSFSPDGRRLASGSDDHTVRVWDAETGEELRVLRGHHDQVTSLSFSPDSRRLASGSRDRTVRVWDATTGEELRVLRGHDHMVTSVLFSPDGRRLASESWDNRVRVWDPDTGRCIDVLHDHSDAGGGAGEARTLPLRAFSRGVDTVVEDAATGGPVAWFPAGLYSMASHPSGHVWAGTFRSHLYLLHLEGAPG